MTEPNTSTNDPDGNERFKAVIGATLAVIASATDLVRAGRDFARFVWDKTREDWGKDKWIAFTVFGSSGPAYALTDGFSSELLYVSPGVSGAAAVLSAFPFLIRVFVVCGTALVGGQLKPIEAGACIPDLAAQLDCEVGRRMELADHLSGRQSPPLERRQWLHDRLRERRELIDAGPGCPDVGLVLVRTLPKSQWQSVEMTGPVEDEFHPRRRAWTVEQVFSGAPFTALAAAVGYQAIAFPMRIGGVSYLLVGLSKDPFSDFVTLEVSRTATDLMARMVADLAPRPEPALEGGAR